MSRRRFLALSATVGVAACAGDDTDADPAPTDASTTSSTTTTTEADPPPETTPSTTQPEPVATTIDEPVFDADPFVYGVASGDPDATSVALWTRLGGDLPDGDVEVAWTVTTDDGTEQGGTVVTNADLGHSVHVVVELDGPASYSFTVPGFASAEGRAAPAPASAGSYRIAAGSCQHFETGHYAAHRDIAEWSPDLVVFLGDFIYEGDARDIDEAAADGLTLVRSHEGPEVVDLDGYRGRYATYLSDPHLQASRAAAPWLCIWDDHEVENNYAATIAQPDDDGPVDPVAFAERRDMAFRAWWENMPTRLDPPTPGEPFVIHRGVDVGELVRVSALDGRQYRSDQLSEATLDIGPPVDGWDDPTRTMLGEEQEAWIADRFTSSSATWNCLVQQTVLSDTRIGPDGSILNYDQWDGYVPARDRLLANAPANFVTLTGDIHLAGIARIGPLEAPVGTEFITTAISSTANVDPSLADLVLGIPSIVDGDLANRGYTRHTVSRDEWIAEYRSVVDVLDADSDVTTWKSFRVEAGSDGVNEV